MRREEVDRFRSRLPRGGAWACWGEWRAAWREVQGGRCHIVRRWVQRTADVPHLVSCTALFLDAITAFDAAGRHSEPAQMQCALSIVRFVNGVVDPLQTKSRAISINALAREAGLPQIFVELRHQATHQAIPSRHVLRYACDKALEWIHKTYWEPQAAVLDRIQDRWLGQVAWMEERLGKGSEEQHQRHAKQTLLNAKITPSLPREALRDLVLLPLRERNSPAARLLVEALQEQLQEGSLLDLVFGRQSSSCASLPLGLLPGQLLPESASPPCQVETLAPCPRVQVGFCHSTERSWEPPLQALSRSAANTTVEDEIELY